MGSPEVAAGTDKAACETGGHEHKVKSTHKLICIIRRNVVMPVSLQQYSPL
jgi:hypothetical protein